MKYLFFIVLLVALVITAGCVSENKNKDNPMPETTPTQAYAKIHTSSYWESSGEGLLQNPFPLLGHIDVVNYGDADGKNVQVVITVLYDNEVVRQETIFFGTVKAGESVIKDVKILIPRPENFNASLIKVTDQVFVNEKEMMKIPSN